MHRKLTVILLMVIMAFPALALQDDQKYAGTWSGTFKSESGGSGTVSFTFKKTTKACGRARSSIQTTPELKAPISKK
jgi:hypothetical protein